MKNALVGTVILWALVVAYSSWSKRSPEAGLDLDGAEISDTGTGSGPEVSEDSAAPAARPTQAGQVITGITGPAGSEVKTLSDGTSVTSVDDGRGNRVESRFFTDHKQIKGVVVDSFQNKTKSVRIILADGSSRMMASEPIADVIRATPSQIASVLGITGDLTIKTTPTPVVEPGSDPSEIQLD